MSVRALRPFLTADAAESFDLLVQTLTGPSLQDFRQLLEKCLREDDLLPVYAVFLAERERLNVSVLRLLYRSFEQAEQPIMALEVIEEVAARTGKAGDEQALYKTEIEVVSREVDRYTPRKKRRRDPGLFEVTSQQAREWTDWIRQADAPQLRDWFNTGKQSATAVLNEGWIFESFDPVFLGPDMDWVSAAGNHRTWGYRLHSWDFLDPLMREYLVREYLEDQDSDLLRRMLGLASSWSEQALSLDAEDTMMWYDMSLSLRSLRLVGLLYVAVEAGVDSEELMPLYRLALAHQDALEAGESFISRNNHGFYAALGQSVLARDLRCIPNMWRSRLQGAARMKLMAQQQFFSDGGHAEHSPDYHRMLLASFQQAIRQDIITDVSVLERIDRASEVLGWLVQPTGKILQWGDSPGRDMVGPKSRALNPHAQFIMTDGRQGEPDSKELFVLPDAGSAIVRTPQPQEQGALKNTSYLAFAAGFHSRAHKHCDDLSFVWTHRGEEVLVDGGRYGYGEQLPQDSPLRKEGFYYAEPERQYVESVRAHNTVSLDGHEHNRRRRPFGSGLLSAEQQGEVFTLVGEAPHEGWSHRRTLVLDQAGPLRVLDEVVAEDEQEHQCDLYFHLSGDLAVTEESGGSLAISTPAGVEMRAQWSIPGELVTAYAQKSPLWGWRSVKDRELIPSWGVRRRCRFTGSLTVETLFTVLSS